MNRNRGGGSSHSHIFHQVPIAKDSGFPKVVIAAAFHDILEFKRRSWNAWRPECSETQLQYDSLLHCMLLELRLIQLESESRTVGQ